MALAAQEAGLPILAYLNQSGFLLGCGIGELLLRTDPQDALRFLPQSKAVHKLVAPSEMGELFKVLIAGHGVELPQAILAADRSHRL
jgi:SAM-dependent MidA family methyltransferase